MQVVPPTAMKSITPLTNAGSTDFPLADAAKILILWISQEDFTSSVHLLRMALQLTSQTGKRCQCDSSVLIAAIVRKVCRKLSVNGSVLADEIVMKVCPTFHGETAKEMTNRSQNRKKASLPRRLAATRSSTQGSPAKSGEELTSKNGISAVLTVLIVTKARFASDEGLGQFGKPY